MSIAELLLLAVALSMDAFAVSVCKGLATKRPEVKNMIKAGLWFGGFQALMPLVGYFFGTAFEKYIEKLDHWLAFALLTFIGIKMIKEAFENEEDNDDFSFKTMLVMALATSVDALAVGIAFAAVKPVISVYGAVGIIGIVTFLLSFIGVVVGNKFGKKYKFKAEITGGVILIIIGLKILLEHICVIAF